jgi:hypothetical protein
VLPPLFGFGFLLKVIFAGSGKKMPLAIVAPEGAEAATAEAEAAKAATAKATGAEPGPLPMDVDSAKPPPPSAKPAMKAIGDTAAGGGVLALFKAAPPSGPPGHESDLLSLKLKLDKVKLETTLAQQKAEALGRTVEVWAAKHHKASPDLCPRPAPFF